MRLAIPFQLSYTRHLQLSLLLVGAMVCLPFLNPHHYHPIPSFYPEWWAAALGTLACTLFLRHEAGKDLRLPQICLIPLALILIFLFQLAAGLIDAVHQGLLFSLYLLWACVMALLGRVLAREAGLERLIDALAWGVLAGGAISLVIVLLQVQHVPLARSLLFHPINTALSANIAQPNQLADYLALGIFSTLHLQAKGRLNFRLALPLAAALAIAMLLTASRSAYVYALLLTGLAWLLRRQSDANARIWKMARLVLLAFVLMEAGQHLHWGSNDGGPLLHTGSERLTTDGGGLSIRSVLWQMAWQSFLSSPWLGVGLGHFSWQSFVLAGGWPPGTLPNAAEHAHNLFLHLLAEMGIAAPLAVLAGLLLFLRGAWGQRRQWGINGFWIGGCLSIVGIHSMLEYPLWYAFFLGPVALLLGAVVPDTLSIRLEKLGRAGMVLLLITAFWILGNLYRDYSVLEDTVYWRNLSTTQASPWPEIHRRLSNLHDNSLLPHYVEFYYAQVAPIGRDNLQEKLTITQNAILFSPTEALVYKYPVLLALAGQADEAFSWARMAAQAYPQNMPQKIAQYRALAASYPEMAAPLQALTATTSGQP